MEKVAIMMRVSKEDKKLLSDAAYKSRLSLSAWMRKVLVLSAQGQLGVKNV